MSIVNPDNKKMILSCDGGGIRGLIAVRCLEKLEKVEGKPCNRIFHLMAGTSTGAIIVACLAVGMPANKIADLFISEGKQIFRKTPNLWTRLIMWKHSKTGVMEIFKEKFGDKVLSELPVDILITAKDTVRSETMFFEKKTFGNMLLREAVESSMSAPTYFKPNGRYVDGGVGSFNNPCYQAAVEAIHYLKYPKGQTRLLSFGTGTEINNMKDGEAERKNKLGWGFYVIGEGMEDANEQQVRLVRREYVSRGEIEFKRYQISFTQEVLNKLGIPTDIVNPSVFKMDAVEHVKNLDLIARKFADYITFKEKGVSKGKGAFEEKGGVELGKKPKLEEKEFKQYLRPTVCG
jgi:hypothetical protein